MFDGLFIYKFWSNIKLQFIIEVFIDLYYLSWGTESIALFQLGITTSVIEVWEINQSNNKHNKNSEISENVNVTW